VTQDTRGLLERMFSIVLNATYSVCWSRFTQGPYYT
jgi:hypothetical protein